MVDMPWWVYGLFLVFVFAMLLLDLVVFNRGNHVIKVRKALLLCGFWVGLALIFNVGVYFFHPRGHQAALEFLTGYIIEESLSVDNLFVFLMLFSYFRVPEQYQHRVLFWGIIGAVVLRAIFIFAGVALINRFHFIIYVFGALLIYTGIKMLFHNEKDIDPEKNFAIRLMRKLIPVHPNYVNGDFLTRIDGKLMATPLMVVVVAVEATDLIFAVDSIPAILAVTRDPFIVLTSNIFAILGLRSIFFALSGVMGMFRHLDKGLCGILTFVGLKMIFATWIKKWLGNYYADPEQAMILISLSVIVTILTLSIIASLVHEKLAPSEKPAGLVEIDE